MTLSSEIQLHDKYFRVSIPYKTIQLGINNIAQRINADFKDEQPLFLCVLNGAFLFSADLLKRITIDCEVSFIKLASYQGTRSSGTVKTLIGLDSTLSNRAIIILEDIVDTGETIDTLMKQLSVFQPKSVKIATLLFKPEAYKKNIPVDYIALTVPNTFLVGYGLDYDGLGRNLKDIYEINHK